MSEHSFFAEYWEQQLLHISGRDPAFYSDTLTPEDVDQYLSRNDIRYPSLRMMHAGTPVPVESFSRTLKFGNYASDGLIDVDRVYDAYMSGASIVLQLMRSSLSGVTLLANNLHKALRSNVEATVYVTPANEQGFTTHYDTHSVFILQVSGKKCWRVYDHVVEQPLLTQQFDFRSHAIGALTKEMVLVPGDLLYVPRGLAHDAAAVGDEPSIHITLGLFPILWRDLLEQRIKQLRADPRFRAAPTSFFEPNSPRQFADEFEKLTDAALDSVSLEALVSLVRREHISRQGRLTKGWLSALEQLGALGEASRITGRRGVVTDMSTEGDRLIIRFYNSVLRLPAVVAPAVDRLLSGDTWIVKDLQPNLDLEGCLTLARRFVVEGLATFAP